MRVRVGQGRLDTELENAVTLSGRFISCHSEVYLKHFSVSGVRERDAGDCLPVWVSSPVPVGHTVLSARGTCCLGQCGETRSGTGACETTWPCHTAGASACSPVCQVRTPARLPCLQGTWAMNT